MLVGTFFTFQSQLLRNIFTLAAVLRQFRTADSRFGTVTPSLDYSRIVTDSIVGLQNFQKRRQQAKRRTSQQRKYFSSFSYLSYYLKTKEETNLIGALSDKVNIGRIFICLFDGACRIHHFLPTLLTVFSTLGAFACLNSTASRLYFRSRFLGYKTAVCISTRRHQYRSRRQQNQFSHFIVHL